MIDSKAELNPEDFDVNKDKKNLTGRIGPRGAPKLERPKTETEEGSAPANNGPGYRSRRNRQNNIGTHLEAARKNLLGEEFEEPDYGD